MPHIIEYNLFCNRHCFINLNRSNKEKGVQTIFHDKVLTNKAIKAIGKKAK